MSVKILEKVVVTESEQLPMCQKGQHSRVDAPAKQNSNSGFPAVLACEVSHKEQNGYVRLTVFAEYLQHATGRSLLDGLSICRPQKPEFLVENRD